MANRIVPKKSSVAAKVPLAADLVQGELAVNLTDKLLYTKDASNNIVKLGANTFDDTLFRIFDNGDTTKIAAFDAAGITTGTTRTYTLPDITATLAHLGNASQTFSGAMVFAKTAGFSTQNTIATTTGAITVDWTAAQNQKQTEPTGTITYTFTAPPSPCHLQLLIDSDGTSTAQTINWPAAVIWLGATWAGTANKKAVVNFWYDGTSYYAIGTNQV